jgi:hypothetical protein
MASTPFTITCSSVVARPPALFLGRRRRFDLVFCLPIRRTLTIDLDVAPVTSRFERQCVDNADRTV